MYNTHKKMKTDNSQLAGQSSEQPDPVEDVPAHCRDIG